MIKTYEQFSNRMWEQNEEYFTRLVQENGYGGSEIDMEMQELAVYSNDKEIIAFYVQYYYNGDMAAFERDFCDLVA